MTPPVTWISVVKAAKRLGVSRSTVYRLEKTPKLRSRRLGVHRRLEVALEDVLAISNGETPHHEQGARS